MKKLVLCIAAIAVFGCSSDDNGASKSDIVGTWHPVATAIGNEAFVNHTDACESKDDFLEIDAEESGIMEYRFYNSQCSVIEMQAGFWKLSGNKIVLASLDPVIGADETIIYKIVSVNEAELVISYAFNDEVKKVKFERMVFPN